MLAAALLHDVVEDSELEVADVRERCGERVAEIVDALSDDESIESYEERKREHRGRVEAAGPDALAIYAADKLTNVTMLRDAYGDQGEAVAEELTVPLDVKVASGSTTWRWCAATPPTSAASRTWRAVSPSSSALWRDGAERRPLRRG